MLVPNVQTLEFKEQADVFTMVYPEFETLNPILGEKIRAQGDQQYRKTNVQADMTKWTMFKDPDFAKIVDFAIDVTEGGLNLPNLGKYYATDCWGAIYKKGEYTKPHEHWPQIWSWVYNVECCEKCSPLIFPDHDIEEYSLIPKKGNLTLFPGWIKHYVPEQKCDHDRIIIAGNLGVNPWKLISGIEKRYNDNLETFINTYK